MNIAIKDKTSKEAGKVKLPAQFDEPVRADIISRAFLAIANNDRQPYGADPEAGMKHSAELSRRRRKYRGSYGAGISRVPRKIMSRRGTRFNWVGALAPGTRGGRRAHAPKATKNWNQKINKKENKKAIRSAMAASIDMEVVTKRGHKAPKDFPFIINDDFEAINKTKDFTVALEKLGLVDELSRASKKTIRSGKGKARGRKYKKRKGPLVVVSGNCALVKAAKNVPGVDIVLANQLNVKLLAPGNQPGRLTLYSKKALEAIDKEKLYM